MQFSKNLNQKIHNWHNKKPPYSGLNRAKTRPLEIGKRVLRSFLKTNKQILKYLCITIWICKQMSCLALHHLENLQVTHMWIKPPFLKLNVQVLSRIVRNFTKEKWRGSLKDSKGFRPTFRENFWGPWAWSAQADNCKKPQGPLL